MNARVTEKNVGNTTDAFDVSGTETEDLLAVSNNACSVNLFFTQRKRTEIRSQKIQQSIYMSIGMNAKYEKINLLF